jgi:hypothetical protein
VAYDEGGFLLLSSSFLFFETSFIHKQAAIAVAIPCRTAHTSTKKASRSSLLSGLGFWLFAQQHTSVAKGRKLNIRREKKK